MKIIKTNMSLAVSMLFMALPASAAPGTLINVDVGYLSAINQFAGAETTQGLLSRKALMMRPGAQQGTGTIIKFLQAHVYPLSNASFSGDVGFWNADVKGAGQPIPMQIAATMPFTGKSRLTNFTRVVVKTCLFWTGETPNRLTDNCSIDGIPGIVYLNSACTPGGADNFCGYNLADGGSTCYAGATNLGGVVAQTGPFDRSIAGHDSTSGALYDADGLDDCSQVPGVTHEFGYIRGDLDL